MYRIFRHYIPKTLLMLGVAEAMVLLVSVYLGVTLSLFHWGGSEPGTGSLLFAKAAIYSAVMVAVMMAMGLYQRDLRDGPRLVLLRIALSFAMGLAVMAALQALAPQLALGGNAFLAALAASFIGISSCRFLCFHRTDHRLAKRVLVLGCGEKAERIGRMRRRTDRSGVDILGFVKLGNGRQVVRDRLIELHAGLDELVDQLRVDEIVIALDDRRNAIPVDDIVQCKMRGVQVIDDATYHERQLGKILLDSLNPSHVIFSDGFSQAALKGSVKRVLDLSVSLLMLLAALPVMALVMLAIKLEDGPRAPVIYRQRRVGRGGSVFEVLKFRSMRPDAESAGKPQWAQARDHRVTRVGSVIRKLRLDELPQLINVLRGDMSFVGPRPERPEFVADLVEAVPYYNLRHHVKPGITGWAQICYPYGASLQDSREKLEFDLYYLKNFSVFLDLTILLQTAQVVLWGKGSR